MWYVFFKKRGKRFYYKSPVSVFLNLNGYCDEYVQIRSSSIGKKFDIDRKGMEYETVKYGSTFRPEEHQL